MLQELTDLDFDTYFDVASSNQHQQQQQQQQSRDILYHDDSQQQQQQQQQNSNSLSSLLNNNNNRQSSSYHYTQQPGQQNFNLFDWDLNPPTSHHSASPMQISPLSSPQSSSDGYTSHTLSPQMINSPPLYASYNSNPQIKDEASKVLEGFFAKRTIYSSLNHLHNVPGINIPTTPITENPPVNSSNLPSPPLENPLSGAFSAIDQWCQLKEQDVIHPLDIKCEEHEPRHWRKTSSRHQQLHQPQPNTLERPEPGKQLKKVAHNAIERRYRNNINDRIRELKNVVPALYKARIREKGEADDDSSVADSDNEQDDVVIVEGVEVAKKLNKATILRKATEYIQFLKNTNDTTEQENLILQQIIAQMPGGNDVLNRFLCQKSEFEKSEQDRLARERRDAQERERTERQRILRERAAQRAALAQLLPKPERRPYRRRQSSKNNAKPTKKSSLLSDDGNNKMFMAAFMCIAFFSASPTSSNVGNLPHSFGAHDNQTNTRSTFAPSTVSASMDIWHILRYTLYTFGIIYVCLIPLLLRWLRPRPVNRPNKCTDHHHYANEVPTAWSRLYTNLISILDKSTSTVKASNNTTSISILSTIFDIFRYTLSLIIPNFIYTIFQKNAKPVGCPEELSYIGAWIRLNEVECLGGNPDITRLGMLHSCVGMLSQLHKMKRDEKRDIYCEENTMARVYATTAIQLELCLPVSISSLVVPYCWTRVIQVMNNKQSLVEQDNNKKQQDNIISTEWLGSNCHDQVLQILAIRNGFTNNDDGSCCRNVFYSFVLPYVTSPLDLVLYWQQLSNLQDCWYSYLNGTRPVFSENQLKHVLSVSATTTAPGHMLQWWVRVGLTLQSLSNNTGTQHQDNLDALAEYTRTRVPQVNNHPSSNLLRRHQTMIYHMLEAATALQTDTNSDQVPTFLKQAAKDRAASTECIQQIASSTKNYEASVLVVSTLAVHLRTLKALIIHQQTTCSPAKRLSSGGSKKRTLLAHHASVYIAELRDQVMQDMESPYTKSLSPKCRKHIQSYIYQADDTLSL